MHDLDIDPRRRRLLEDSKAKDSNRAAMREAPKIDKTIAEK